MCRAVDEGVQGSQSHGPPNIIRPVYRYIISWTYCWTLLEWVAKQCVVGVVNILSMRRAPNLDLAQGLQNHWICELKKSNRL